MCIYFLLIVSCKSCVPAQPETSPGSIRNINTTIYSKHPDIISVVCEVFPSERNEFMQKTILNNGRYFRDFQIWNKSAYVEVSAGRKLDSGPDVEKIKRMFTSQEISREDRTEKINFLFICLRKYIAFLSRITYLRSFPRSRR